MNSIWIVKLNTNNIETWRYKGQILKQSLDQITVEAFFDKPDIQFHGMLLRKGDRFVETYFTKRWYNIFEIHAKEDDSLRGWYCNVSTPAIIREDRILYIDLALDLLVFPDRSQIILDKEEFELLEISNEMRINAEKALDELQKKFNVL